LIQLIHGIQIGHSIIFFIIITITANGCWLFNTDEVGS